PLLLWPWCAPVSVGAGPSMFSPPTVWPALLLPATSVAGSLVTAWPAPLALTSLSLGALAPPDRFSSRGPPRTPARFAAHENPATTSPPYQPSLFGCVFGAPMITGAVRSILIP